MPDEALLTTAVTREIISEDQANSLRLLASELATAKPTKDDEGFRFITGFSDVFLAIGAILVMTSLAKTGLMLNLAGMFLIAAICWGLSEIFATWQKRSLPSMASAVGFVYYMMTAVFTAAHDKTPQQVFNSPLIGTFERHELLTMGGAVGGLVLLSSLLYYARFKLPFTLLLAAVGFTSSILCLIALAYDFNSNISLVVASLFILGLIVFYSAMYFDTQDRERKTRLSDNAFWLHLVASPLIVHSIMWQCAIWLVGSQNLSGRSIEAIATPLSFVVLAIFFVILCVALIIDRRAMLVSSFIYVTISLSYIVTSTGEFGFAVTSLPVFIGAAIIAIGIAWRNLRQIIFTILPLRRIEHLLPPVRRPIQV